VAGCRGGGRRRLVCVLWQRAVAGELGFGLGFGVPSLWEKRGDVFQRRSLFCLEEVICFGCNIYHVPRWRYPLEAGDLVVVVITRVSTPLWIF
jgi:hypothetical protein